MKSTGWKKRLEDESGLVLWDGLQVTVIVICLVVLFVIFVNSLDWDSLLNGIFRGIGWLLCWLFLLAGPAIGLASAIVLGVTVIKLVRGESPKWKPILLGQRQFRLKPKVLILGLGAGVLIFSAGTGIYNMLHEDAILKEYGGFSRQYYSATYLPSGTFCRIGLWILGISLILVAIQRFNMATTFLRGLGVSAKRTVKAFYDSI